MQCDQKSPVPPVLFIVFNRLETVIKTLAAIRKAAPSEIFIAADGPREDVPGEAEKCQAVRAYILEQIDWDCRIKTRFLDRNLGCRNAVSSAVDWFFSEVEEGIILEDDCLPSEDFFRFASAALEFYRNDPLVAHINGSVPFSAGNNSAGKSACFYRYAHIWGWASWRRAWKFYDVSVSGFDPQKMYDIFPDDRRQAKRWNQIIQNVMQDKPGFNTWDFQWTYEIMANGLWCISPAVNLVSNIGTGEGTHDMVSEVMELKTGCLLPELDFPAARDPQTIRLENQVFQMIYACDPLIVRIKKQLKKILNRF